MTQSRIDDLAPDFTLPGDQGAFNLSAHLGHPVVLFFYPQDDTEGCTMEAKHFSALLPDFAALETTIAGISPDSVDDHARFRKKFGLTVPLLADPDREVINTYGVWGPKKTFGREYEGLIRTTFLIGQDGRIAKIWKVTRIKGHAAAVLEAVGHADTA